MMATNVDSKLVKRDTAIAALFGPDDRPSPRTWSYWLKRKVVPVIRIGRLHFYDIAACRDALARFAVNTPKARA
jgi:hypothetical protein